MNGKRYSFVQYGLWDEKIFKDVIDGKDMYYFLFLKGIKENYFVQSKVENKKKWVQW